MVRNTHKFPRQLASAIAVVALAAPATSVALPREAVDHRSPDAVDAAIQAEEAQRNYESIQSLDARRQEPGYVDHRSPDAQDSGWVSPPPPAEIGQPSGFDWGDAGIGAGSVLGLVLITLSVMFTVVHRRNRAATT